MKFLLITLVGCLYAAQVQAENIMDKEGHLTEFRPKTGHFRLEPFMELFENYASAFIKPRFPQLPADDPSFYTPTAISCINFFQRFRIDEYKVRNLEEIVLLDACLGYLYESEYHAHDKEQNPYVNDNLDTWINDEVLKKAYTKTKIDQFSDSAKDCVGDLLLGAIRIKKQFPTVSCNNHFLELFLEFAACQKDTIPAVARQSDSYMNIIFELLKVRGKECFEIEIQHINDAVRGKYANSLTAATIAKVFGGSVAKQASTRYWPSNIKKVLEAMTQPQKELNLRDVNKIVRGVRENQLAFKNRLLTNMATYADKEISSSIRKKATKDDSFSLYKSVIDKLCTDWRKTDNPKYYDYVTPFERMIRMLNYEDIFGISVVDFQSKVTNLAYESSPVYYSVSACNILTFTDGYVPDAVPGREKKFVVQFVPDTSRMVLWPDAGFY